MLNLNTKIKSSSDVNPADVGVHVNHRQRLTFANIMVRLRNQELNPEMFY